MVTRALPISAGLVAVTVAACRGFLLSASTTVPRMRPTCSPMAWARAGIRTTAAISAAATTKERKARIELPHLQAEDVTGRRRHQRGHELLLDRLGGLGQIRGRHRRA